MAIAVSFSTERIEKGRLNIPAAAFHFWEQQDFNALFFKNSKQWTNLCSINLILEKKKQKELRIYWLKCSKSEEILACLICIQRWQKNTSTEIGGNQLQDTESSHVFVHSNDVGFRKYSKNYQASNVKMIIQKRLIILFLLWQLTMLTLVLQTYKSLNWSHQAVFTFLRSATNIFLIQIIGEFHELKSNMLEKEESVIGGKLMKSSGRHYNPK